ncbi:hypothetical protein L208DRAFT_1547221 [Tricholoma matsutake]|nr:hypothetical protein L208DRAFT_1547221 [Tricholoma matsutake 945]
MSESLYTFCISTSWNAICCLKLWQLLGGSHSGPQCTHGAGIMIRIEVEGRWHRHRHRWALGGCGLGGYVSASVARSLNVVWKCCVSAMNWNNACSTLGVDSNFVRSHERLPIFSLIVFCASWCTGHCSR